jgi:hypothetical protein
VPRVGHNRILRDQGVVEQAVSFLGPAR